MSDGTSGLQLRSLLKKSGELELSLVDVPTPEPADDEVVVRVEATPINPSDLGLLIGPADMSTAKVSGSKEAPVITAKMPEAGWSPARVGMRSMRADASETSVIGVPVPLQRATSGSEKMPNRSSASSWVNRRRVRRSVWIVVTISTCPARAS